MPYDNGKKSDYGNDMKGGNKGKRRSMGGSLEDGVSSRETFKDKYLRDEDPKSQQPKSGSEDIGDGMSIVQ